MQSIVRSNCIVWAVRRYTVLVRARWVSGRRQGCEPALRIRPSRLEPRKAPHFAVEHFDGTRWMREGWKPLDKRPLPWWCLWRALWADGEIVRETI